MAGLSFPNQSALVMLSEHFSQTIAESKLEGEDRVERNVTMVVWRRKGLRRRLGLAQLPFSTLHGHLGLGTWAQQMYFLAVIKCFLRINGGSLHALMSRLEIRALHQSIPFCLLVLINDLHMILVHLRDTEGCRVITSHSKPSKVDPPSSSHVQLLSRRRRMDQKGDAVNGSTDGRHEC